MIPVGGTCRTSDGLELRQWHWGAAQPWCRLVLVHGLGEHTCRYADWAEPFVAASISVHGVDLRGHGASPGRRGGAATVAEHVRDVDALVESLPGEEPVVLYGHSLGGLVVLEYLAASRSSRVVGAIVASPWLRLAFSPHPLKILLARVVSSLCPRLTVHSGLKSTDLARPAAVAQAYREDALVHPRVSVGLFSSAVHAGAQWCANPPFVACPLLFMHGDADRITDWRATKACVGRLGSGATLKLWSGALHELHHEACAAEVACCVLEWIRATYR